MQKINNTDFCLFCLMFHMLLQLHYHYFHACFASYIFSDMGGPKIASHTLKGTKKCLLKRGKIYLFDCMNLLYSLCCLSSIADLLVQIPAVPTRQLVSLSVYHLSGFCACICILLCLIFFYIRYLRTLTNGTRFTASVAKERNLKQCVSSLSSTG